MKYHQKEARKYLNTLEAFSLIFSCLFFGLLATFFISGGSDITGVADAFAFVGILLLMSVIGGLPVTALLFWILVKVRHGETNPYDMGWHDGIEDYPTYHKKNE